MHTLNLPAVPALIIIADYFLSQCALLEVLHLHSGGASTRGRRMTLGSHFCLACSSLKTVDLPKLASISIIPMLFMYKCTSLAKLDISHMTKVTQIDQDFCGENVNLETLILPPTFVNIKILGPRFLKNCASLNHSLQLHQMRELSSVGAEFMLGCPSGDRIIDDAGGGEANGSSTHDDIAPILRKALTMRSEDEAKEREKKKISNEGCVLQ